MERGGFTQMEEEKSQGKQVKITIIDMYEVCSNPNETMKMGHF
jgi:hypothetical protein